MAEVWTTILTLQAGGTNPQQAYVGPTTRPGQTDLVSENISALVGTLRVGFSGPTYQGVELLRADLRVPDNGTFIQGIDLPFVIAIAMPVYCLVYPIGAAPLETLNVVVSAFTEVDAGISWGATRSDFVVAAAVLPLAPWCQAVSLHDNAATGTWQDAAGAAVGVFQGYRPRPRQAVSVLIAGANTMVTQHFST